MSAGIRTEMWTSLKSGKLVKSVKPVKRELQKKGGGGGALNQNQNFN